jgi:signal transduction histidine kinase
MTTSPERTDPEAASTAARLAAASHEADAEARAAMLRDANEQLLLGALHADEAVAELLLVASSRERLLGILSHDLRAPLHSIMTGSMLLIDAGRLAPEDVRIANIVHASSARMARLIDQILDFTRARLGGGFVLDRRSADLRSLCDEIAAELRVGAGAPIEVRAEGDLRGCWDVDRLGQVISNLVSNAIAHGRPGGPIEIRAVDAGAGWVAVMVTNEGPPIPDDILPVLFEPFRTHSGDDRARGPHLGIGLYIAREMVAAHGGTLDASSVGGRTTFTVRLPRGSDTAP